MPSGEHLTVAIKVWVDVDLGIYEMVLYLNSIPGVRTLYSCEGTIGEGGPHPYPPQVGCTWADDETLKLLLREFDVTLMGNYWGDVHPRPWSRFWNTGNPTRTGERLGLKDG